MANLWNYQGKPIQTIEDLPDHENLHGFVYLIKNLANGKIYVGKKALYHKTKKKISKTEKEKTKTRKIFHRGVKESDWKKYHGSCLELKNDIKELGEDCFERIILVLCKTSKYLGYMEVVMQIQHRVIEVDSYNGNILGKYYRRDMENLTEDTHDIRRNQTVSAA